MNVKELFTDDRAVSPVVGVALLIAITVILAAVIGGVVLGLGTSSADAPQASLQFEYSDSDGDGTVDDLTITHKGGDTLLNQEVVVRDANGDTSLGSDISAGQSVTVNSVTPNAAGEITVVWQDPNSDDESIIGTYEDN